ADALAHHENAAMFLAAEEEAGEIGVADVECAQECGFARREQRMKTGGVGCEFAVMSEAAGDAQPQEKKFFEGEKMAEDFAKRWRAAEDDGEVVTRMRALGGHERDGEPGADPARGVEKELRK